MPSRRAGGRSLHRRLMDFTAAVCCLVLLVGGVSMGGWLRLRDQTESLTVRLGPAVDTLNTVRDQLNVAENSVRGLTATGQTQAVTRQLRSEYGKARAALLDALAALDRQLADMPADNGDIDRDELLRRGSALRSTSATWLTVTDRVFAGTPSTDAAGRLRAFDDVRQAANTLGERLDRSRFASRAAMREAVLRAIVAILVVTGLAGLLALVASRRMSRALTVPLEHLRDVVHRQREGDRTAWARTDLGASEVGQLAADINALSRAQFRLLDEQAESLRLQEAATAAGRRIHAEADRAGAFAEVARIVGEALGARRVWLGCVAPDGTMSDLAGSPDAAAPSEDLSDTGASVVELWRTHQTLALGHPGGPDQDRDDNASLRSLDPTHALLVATFGPTRHTVGAMVVHGEEDRQTWTPAEVAFAESVAGKLGRSVAQERAEKEREDYIRRLEELDQRKDDFMATVSHELRTPLANILGYLELVQGGDVGDLDPRQRRMLDLVSRNAARLRGLIDDLLVLNQMATSAVTPDGRGPVDLADIVSGVAEAMGEESLGRDVRVEVHTVNTPPVVGDAAQLSRAVANVVANAIKFSRGGGVVRLSCGPLPGGAEAEIVCSDTGMGVPAAEQHKLFTRFFRASNVTQAQIQGTGLGLIIVRAIVERHGGRVALESREGAGTTVRLVLPTVSGPVRDGGSSSQVDSAAGAAGEPGNNGPDPGIVSRARRGTRDDT